MTDVYVNWLLLSDTCILVAFHIALWRNNNLKFKASLIKIHNWTFPGIESEFLKVWLIWYHSCTEYKCIHLYFLFLRRSTFSINFEANNLRIQLFSISRTSQFYNDVEMFTWNYFYKIGLGGSCLFACMLPH